MAAVVPNRVSARCCSVIHFEMSDTSLPVFKGSTVRVSILNAGVLVSPSSMFVQPQIPGHDIIEAPIYSFLVENKRLGKKVLFDLGMMKTWEEKLPQCTSLGHRRSFTSHL